MKASAWVVLVLALLQTGNASAADDGPTVAEVMAMPAGERAAFYNGYFSQADTCAKKWFYDEGGRAKVEKYLADLPTMKEPTQPGAPPLDFYKSRPMAEMLGMSTFNVCANRK